MKQYIKCSTADSYKQYNSINPDTIAEQIETMFKDEGISYIYVDCISDTTSRWIEVIAITTHDDWERDRSRIARLMDDYFRPQTSFYHFYDDGRVEYKWTWGIYESGLSFDFSYDINYNEDEITSIVNETFEMFGLEVTAVDYRSVDWYAGQSVSQCGVDFSYIHGYPESILIDVLYSKLESIGVELEGSEFYSLRQEVSIMNHYIRATQYTRDDIENMSDKEFLKALCKHLNDIGIDTTLHNYELIAESYERYSPGSVYKLKFRCPGDYLAYFIMQTHDEALYSLAGKVWDYIDDSAEYPFDSLPWKSVGDIYDYAASNWWGDGDDYIISLENLDTGECLYESDTGLYDDGEYEDDGYNDWDE